MPDLMFAGLSAEVASWLEVGVDSAALPGCCPDLLVFEIIVRAMVAVSAAPMIAARSFALSEVAAVVTVRLLSMPARKEADGVRSEVGDPEVFSRASNARVEAHFGQVLACASVAASACLFSMARSIIFSHSLSDILLPSRFELLAQSDDKPVKDQSRVAFTRPEMLGNL